MVFKFGRHTAVISKSHPKNVRPISPQKVEEIRRALEVLPSILGNSRWALTGGLVVPLTVGHFYRDHDDLDVAIDERDLFGACRSAWEHGYGLFSRIFMAKLPGERKIELYEEPTASDLRMGRLSRPRFVRVDRKGDIRLNERFLSYIDVYPYRVIGNRIVHYLDNISFSVTASEGQSYTTASGKPLPLRSAAYFVNCGQTGLKHDRDIEALTARA